MNGELTYAEDIMQRKNKNGLYALTLREEILNELNRQLKKWGLQNHHPHKWLVILMEEVGESAEASLGHLDWSDYRKELIQVAAVALSAINCLDRDEWEVNDVIPDTPSAKSVQRFKKDRNENAI